MEILRNPEPYPFQQIPRFSVGPMSVRSVKGGFAGVEVRFGRVDPFGALEDFPKCVKREIDGDADISGDEIVNHPRLEDVEAIEQDDDAEEDEGKPGGVGLEGGLEDEGVAVDALDFERLVKLNVRDANADPGEEISDGGEILEPLKHDRGARGATQKGEEGNGCSNDDAIIWYAPVQR